MMLRDMFRTGWVGDFSHVLTYVLNFDLRKVVYKNGLKWSLEDAL